MNLFDSDNYPRTEPTELVVGDRWAWVREDLGLDYDPAAYLLKYAFRRQGAGIEEIEITASASGTDYVVEVGAATTAAFVSGRWNWQAYITRTSDSERVMVDYGGVEIAPNRDTNTDDPREHAQIMVDALQAAMQRKASKDQLSYSIGFGDGSSRSLSLMSWTEIQGAYQYWKSVLDSEIAAARVKSGLGSGNKILARFF